MDRLISVDCAQVEIMMMSTVGPYALYSESNDKETEVLKLNFIHKREAYP